MRSELERDFERFKRELPRDFPDHVRAAYGVDLTARYLGETVPHPIGKGSGQLSLNGGQLEDDAAAGLAFVVLKTDRKSTRLNSSHSQISYAVFCLKKKKKTNYT